MISIRENGAYSALKKVMVHWGFGDIEADIYSLLVLSKRSMTAREIAEEIGYAYSSVVNGLNNLRRHYLVEREKNGRCYAYSANINIIQILKNERRLVISYLTEAKNALENDEDYEDIVEHLEEGIKYLGKVEKEVK